MRADDPGAPAHSEALSSGTADPELLLETQVKEALCSMLKGTARWCNQVTAAALNAAPEQPGKVVRARLRSSADSLVQSHDLFRGWITTGRQHVIQAAVVGEPGSGKTLLLAEFARYVNGVREIEPTSADRLSPLLMFVPATEPLGATVSRRDSLRNQPYYTFCSVLLGRTTQWLPITD